MRLIAAVVAIAGFILGKGWLALAGAGLFALTYANRSSLPRIVARGLDAGDSLGNSLTGNGNARGPLPAMGDVQSIGVTTSYTGVRSGGGGCGCAS